MRSVGISRGFVASVFLLQGMLVGLAGGLVGASVGIYLFTLLRTLGQLDLIISLFYVIFLSVIGGLMLAHTAGQQGRVAAMTISGEDMVYDQDNGTISVKGSPESSKAFAELAFAATTADSG